MRRINSFSYNIDMQVGPLRLGGRTNWYIMPVDGTIAKQEGVNISPMLKLKICTEAMKVLYEVGDRRFTGIRSAAKTTGAVKGHSNKGKSMVFKEYDPIILLIWDHFNHFLGLGEVRATHFIQARRGERGQCD